MIPIGAPPEPPTPIGPVLAHPRDPGSLEIYRKDLERYRSALESYREASPASDLSRYRDGIAKYRDGIEEYRQRVAGDARADGKKPR